MRKFVLVLCAALAFSISSRGDASTVVDIGTSTFVVPQFGTPRAWRTYSLQELKAPLTSLATPVSQGLALLF